MTCETCKNRTERCCGIKGEIVADFIVKTLKGSVTGINEEKSSDYFRPSCEEYND